MKIKTHPTSKNLAKAVTLELSLAEAIGFASLLGVLTGTQADAFKLEGSYDELASALESIPTTPTTISQLTEAFGCPYVHRAKFFTYTGDQGELAEVL